MLFLIGGSAAHLLWWPSLTCKQNQLLRVAAVRRRRVPGSYYESQVQSYIKQLSNILLWTVWKLRKTELQLNKHNILTQCNWQAKNTGFENY